MQCCESMPWRPIQSIAYHYCSGRLGPWYHIGPWATRPLETSCQAQSICATLPTRMLSVPPQLQPAGYRMRVGFADVATPATAAPSRGSHRLLPQLTSQFRSQLIGQTGTKDCRSRCDFWLLPPALPPAAAARPLCTLSACVCLCAHSACASVHTLCVPLCTLCVCASVHTLCVCLCAHSVHTLRVPLCTLCVCLCAHSVCASVCGHGPVPQSPSSAQQSGADASTL